MLRRSSLGAAAGAALLFLAVSGTAIAADPVGASASGQLVGVVDDTAGKTPEQLG